MRRKYLIGVVGVVALTIGLAACGDTPDAATTASEDEWLARAAEPVPVAVEAVEVGWSRLVDDVTASGLVRGSHEVTLVTETQGVIERVDFTLGDAVEAGDVLVTFDDTIETLAVEEARQTVASAELDAATADRLLETGNGSQVQVTRARSALAGARARLAQAEKALADRTIEAPISGVIATVDASIQRGNSVGRGVPVARIIDTSELEAVLSIGEREIQYVAKDAPAFVRFMASGGGEIAATVHAIGAGSDPATGSFPVVVRWQNELGEQAKAGLSVRVRIPPSNAPWGITVPANAVRSAGDEAWVFVDADGVADERAVVLGDRTGDRIVVRSGIAAGETVIVSGLGQLADGTLVESTIRVAQNR
jgi:membrane fusion protein (multidrug efflux system)